MHQPLNRSLAPRLKKASTILSHPSALYESLRTNAHFQIRQFQKQHHHQMPSSMGDENRSLLAIAAPISQEASVPPTLIFTFLAASIYVLSGVTQPLIVAVAKDAGLADPTCQFYMFFYYLGPASVVFMVLGGNRNSWPSLKTIYKAVAIALVDIVAQAMNYTGSSFAGPTIFAIIYSSVTVWTALFSFVFLKRKMSIWQWMGVVFVFGGLTITAWNAAVSLGPNVFNGSILVIAGSALHALMYVLSEAIMTHEVERLTIPQNCAIQGIVACSAFAFWQVVYTRRHFTELIQTPMNDAGTTAIQAITILFSFSLANLVHALSFFHTLKHFPGGATSAGVMKGLQAVLVFVVTSWVFCGRSGGSEMCFTRLKFLSLIVVVTGLCIYGKATEQRMQHGSKGGDGGYSRIEEEEEEKSTSKEQRNDKNVQVV
mmetsp:Transcript_10537/g.16186  ORF Transcript_10537/g.16186 Transcript_10537/m.16186 type:complete len:429 (-) Transcript_10537:45-1331(-)